MTARLCASCGIELDPSYRIDRVTCGDACRQAASRARRRVTRSPIVTAVTVEIATGTPEVDAEPDEPRRDAYWRWSHASYAIEDEW